MLLFTEKVVVVDDDVPEGTPPSMVCHITRATSDKSCKPEELKSRDGLPGKPCFSQKFSLITWQVIHQQVVQQDGVRWTVHADSARATSITPPFSVGRVCPHS